MANKAKAKKKPIQIRTMEFMARNRRAVRWTAVIVVLLVIASVGALYDVDTSHPPSGIITVSISGVGPTAVYNVSFLSLTAPVPVYDICLRLTGNYGTLSVLGFNVGSADHYYNNASLYRAEIITSSAQPSNISIGAHILISGGILSQVDILKLSTSGKIASYTIT